LRLFLLGGATASGKSRSGNEVARRLGLHCVSADALWKALMSVTSRESHPAFHYFEPTEEEWRRGPDFVCERHVESAQAQTPALQAFIDWELKEGHSMLLEGAWITPEMAARHCEALRDTRAVFIHEPDEDGILASMVERQLRDSPSERQIRLAAMAWRYGNRLRDGARKHGLPVVEARPRDTLVDRIIEAADLFKEASR
jgi:2-phosphoglycerate kinase